MEIVISYLDETSTEHKIHSSIPLQEALRDVLDIDEHAGNDLAGVYQIEIAR